MASAVYIFYCKQEAEKAYWQGPQAHQWHISSKKATLVNPSQIATKVETRYSNALDLGICVGAQLIQTSTQLHATHLLYSRQMTIVQRTKGHSVFFKALLQDSHSHFHLHPTGLSKTSHKSQDKMVLSLVGSDGKFHNWRCDDSFQYKGNGRI